MSKWQKRIQKWTTTKQPIPVDEVLAVLYQCFSKQKIRWRGGSHIIIQDERLKDIHDCGKDGILTIPVLSGQRIKPFYIHRRLIPILELLGYIGENKSE